MRRHVPISLVLLSLLLHVTPTWGQYAAPPTTSTAPAAPAVPTWSQQAPPTTSPPGATGGLSPLPPRSTYTSPSATLGTPTYDAYNNGAAPGAFAPAVPNAAPYPPSPTGSMFNPWPGGANGMSSGYSTVTPPPLLSAPTGSYPGGTYPPATGPPASHGYPSSVYPSEAPPVLIPGGSLTGGYGGSGYYNPFGEFAIPGAFKLLQGPRFQHGWLAGGEDGRDLGVHETQVSVAMAFPNFLWSGQPIYVLPSFSLDLWQGPANGTADLPSSAYEAFLDFGWQTDPNQILGLEMGARIGVFSDFDTFNSDSMRYLGQALGKLRLTPQLTGKIGVMYIDRVQVQLIPAGGLLWQPSPYSRWDLYFPEPKVSHYLSTLGTKDLWWYIAGEYGGGSWTITRTSGQEDRVDINDIRVLAGLEWGRSDLIRSGRRTGFFEVGWVFEREIVYEKTPGDVDPKPTFMIRAGFGY